MSYCICHFPRGIKSSASETIETNEGRKEIW
jgi:hypothetical protein